MHLHLIMCSDKLPDGESFEIEGDTPHPLPEESTKEKAGKETSPIAEGAV